jgi:hypothetical protein
VGGPEYNRKYTVICWSFYYKIKIKTNRKLIIRKINLFDIYFKYNRGCAQYMMFIKDISKLSSSFQLQFKNYQIRSFAEDGCERGNCQSAVTQKYTCNTQVPMLQVPNNDNKKKELLNVHDI